MIPRNSFRRAFLLAYGLDCNAQLRSAIVDPPEYYRNELGQIEVIYQVQSTCANARLKRTLSSSGWVYLAYCPFCCSEDGNVPARPQPFTNRTKIPLNLRLSKPKSSSPDVRWTGTLCNQHNRAIFNMPSEHWRSTRTSLLNPGGL
jgi:hypothetical protein